MMMRRCEASRPPRFGVREDSRIHALVTDVAMPQMSGPALAEQLLRERPEMRVLFVSGYAEDGMVNRMLDDGVALLQKPYDIRVLARRVRDLFETKVAEPA
jgi:FixJ family two-component response regulator